MLKWLGQKICLALRKIGQMKGLPISLITEEFLHCQRRFPVQSRSIHDALFTALFIHYWPVSIFPDSFSLAARKRVTFGTASIQHLNASGSITPTAPPSPLITELFCSWAWPIGMAENIFLWINAQQSSLCETLMTSGWSFSSDISTIQSVNQGVQSVLFLTKEGSRSATVSL